MSDRKLDKQEQRLLARIVTVYEAEVAARKAEGRS